MSWLALLAPVFFVFALFALLALAKRVSPRAPPTPDPVGLRTVARFSYESGDPASLMDALARALEEASLETSPWRWDREGAYLECSFGTARFQIDLTVYGETCLFVSGVGTESPMLGPPVDGEGTRRVLRAVDGALRTHPKVRELRWRRREIDAVGGEGQHSAPFDDG
jgi:hypothetical protein